MRVCIYMCLRLLFSLFYFSVLCVCCLAFSFLILVKLFCPYFPCFLCFPAVPLICMYPPVSSAFFIISLFRDLSNRVKDKPIVQEQVNPQPTRQTSMYKEEASTASLGSSHEFRNRKSPNKESKKPRPRSKL